METEGRHFIYVSIYIFWNNGPLIKRTRLSPFVLAWPASISRFPPFLTLSWLSFYGIFLSLELWYEEREFSCILCTYSSYCSVPPPTHINALFPYWTRKCQKSDLVFVYSQTPEKKPSESSRGRKRKADTHSESSQGMTHTQHNNTHELERNDLVRFWKDFWFCLISLTCILPVPIWALPPRHNVFLMSRGITLSSRRWHSAVISFCCEVPDRNMTDLYIFFLLHV